ncbi:hypothetical protein [Paracoccus sp. PAR01]|uniref:hypothetical protein n=1 Tax=Paracoccus sp. PAR01 TaxID=2769282 RepID=UPI0017823AE6|nr:hypothetical protein [Paracoccus sp. PAR01]MBD9528365.1 hypothetical protein [Paracoccus sp. PAR01]
MKTIPSELGILDRSCATPAPSASDVKVTEKTVLECLPQLLRHARSLGLNDDATEELVARTLTWAIEHVDRFNPHFGLENWLIFIADMLECEIFDPKSPITPNDPWAD